jgi:hypothetical protein
MISCDKNAACVINTYVASSISSLRQARARHMHKPTPMMERTLARCIETNETTTAHSSPIPSRNAYSMRARCKFYIKIYKNNQDLLHHTGAIPERSRGPHRREQQKGLLRFILPRN